MQPIQLNLSLTLAPNTANHLIDLIARGVRQGSSSHHRVESLQSATSSSLVGKQAPKEEPLLIDSRQASKLLGVSPRKLWQMQNSGEMPAPAKIGRLVRWGYEELRAWVAAGCPKCSKGHWDR